MKVDQEKHEQKFCPRCQTSFVCKVGDIANCQCCRVELADDVLHYMQETYADCLCANCMKSMKQELNVKTSQTKMNRIIGIKTTNQYE